MKKDLKYFYKKCILERPNTNFTKNEIRARSSLQQNKDIVIKPADKGNVVVVMDRFQYLWEGNKQLADEKYYRKLDAPIFPERKRMVARILERLCEQKFITKKQKEYLLGPAKPRPSQFYLLPKIHKDKKDWSDPNNIPPGRPIVSDCSSETCNTAEYVPFRLDTPAMSKIRTILLMKYANRESLKQHSFLQWTSKVYTRILTQQKEYRL